MNQLTRDQNRASVYSGQPLRPSAGRLLVPSPVERKPPTVQAVKHVRRMRGGAQSHLILADDGYYYIVKLQNNPQDTRVLVNDWIGTRLGEMIGLPVPATAIVTVDSSLLERTPELSFELCGLKRPCTAGPSFGSRYVISPSKGSVYDYLPGGMISEVRNCRDFAGALALDKWTCNTDGRQVVYWKKSRERKFTASFIDQGYCFNAGEWSFPDAPLRGVFCRNDVYQWVTGWECFEPWLSRIENFPECAIWKLAEEVPPEWYNSDTEALKAMLTRLCERRVIVHELILSFKESLRNPFPEWTDA